MAHLGLAPQIAGPLAPDFSHPAPDPSRGTRRRLPVVPLIPDKRYYGESPVGLRRYERAVGGRRSSHSPENSEEPSFAPLDTAGRRQRGELRSVGQGFVTCHRAGIAGDPPRLASTRARRSGGGSGAPLTSLRCRVLPLGAAMLLAPELNDAPGGSLGSVLI